MSMIAAMLTKTMVSTGSHGSSLESSNLSLSAILQNSKDFIDIKHEDRVDIFTNASFQSAHTLNMSNSGFSISARFAQTICGLFSVPYAYVHSATFIPLLKLGLKLQRKATTIKI